MLIVEQSTLQNWWHNHRWGFRLLVNACHWTRIKNPHVGVNWPRRVSQELRVPHPGGRRSHCGPGFAPTPTVTFKKDAWAAECTEAIWQRAGTWLTYHWSGVALFYQRTQKTHLEVVGVSHGNTTEAAVSEFPAPSCWLYKLCICLNEGIRNKVNMLRNDGAAQDDSLYLSLFSLWFEHGAGSIFSFPFPFVGRIPSKRVTWISTPVCIDINNDAIHYRNTGVR